MKIKSLHAREILDSRGNPTIETELILDSGSIGVASVPSGASVGSKEALELRDGGKRYLGKGVFGAVSNVNTKVAEAIIGREFSSQGDLDRFLIELDGSENKSNLGANSILSVSIAFAYAVSAFKSVPLFIELSKGGKCSLPRPMMNIINGGAHADNALDIQEFMIVPVKKALFKDILRMGAEVFHTLKDTLKKHGYNTNVGDEGGFAPAISSSTKCIELILEAIQKAGYVPGEDIAIAIDSAATEFWKEGQYIFEGCSLDSDEMISLYESLVRQYPIISLEDPLAEFDNEGWKNLTALIGKKVQIVGDDLFVTNSKILQSGIEEALANAILVKPNQVGTLTESIRAAELALENGFGAIISHRSGETESTMISHMAVGLNTGQIKTGSLCRTDRVAKYNELLRIEEIILQNEL